MTPDLFEMARNLYGAGGGSVPPSAWTAAVATLLWMIAHRDAIAAGRHLGRHGGTDRDDETFRDTFADRLGWSMENYEQFWRDSRYDFAASDVARVDDEFDAWTWMTTRR
jgi:hypothetical protein